MSELRQNLASKEWVVIATERAKKPISLKTKVVTKPVSDKEYDPECPFCPGNEEKSSVMERFRIEDSNGKWVVRVIDNKYKILDSFDSCNCPLIPGAFEKKGIYQRLDGYGSHELVIETNKHNRVIADMTLEEVKNIISAYLNRYKKFKENPNNLITVIFKNYGAMAGQTQPHSHTQIIGSRIVPLHIRYLLHEAEKHFDNYGSCVFCDILHYELKEKIRLIYQNDDYVAFVSYAAGSEHETWIMPKLHNAGLDYMEDKMVDSLSDIVRIVLRKFQMAIDNPDFNFVIRTAPYPLSNVPFYHWHIQFLPRTKISGGFERGTRIQVNTILPEESAKRLRECKKC